MSLGNFSISLIFSHPLVPLALDLGAADPQVRLRAVRGIVQQLADPGFLELVRQQLLTQLVYATLTRFPRAAVGKVPLMEALRQDYLRQYRGYKPQERETLLLAQTLAAAGVEGILLKGGDVRHRLYDDPVCRPMGDVDVLICPADLDKVRIALAGCGYRLALKDHERGPDFNRRFAWEELYASPRGTGVLFDIHWEIRKMGAFYRLPYAPLRARAKPMENGWEGFLALAPEHLLMNLCLNTLEELEHASIMKLVDLERALTRLPLNRELFLEDAAVFQIQGPLFAILKELADLRPQAVPEWVLAQLAAYVPSWSEQQILKRREGSLLWASLATLRRHLPPQGLASLFAGQALARSLLYPDKLWQSIGLPSPSPAPDPGQNLKRGASRPERTPTPIDKAFSIW
ncbi:MAG: nucleotidyltransferase family protein [Desulfobaccales bacterium]